MYFESHILTKDDLLIILFLNYDLNTSPGIEGWYCILMISNHKDLVSSLYFSDDHF